MLAAKKVVDGFIERQTVTRGDKDNRISHKFELPEGDLLAIIKITDSHSGEAEMKIETIQNFIHYLILSDMHHARKWVILLLSSEH